jgi:hypothetical protein
LGFVSNEQERERAWIGRRRHAATVLPTIVTVKTNLTVELCWKGPDGPLSCLTGAP